MGHKKVSFAEKNAARKAYKGNTARHKKALEMRREFGGTFGDPHLCHVLNYNLMVTGTSAEDKVRLDKDGSWA